MSRPCASPARWSLCLLVVGLLGLTEIGVVRAEQPGTAEPPAPAAASAESPASAPAASAPSPSAARSAAPAPATPGSPTGPGPTTADAATNPAQLSLKDLTEQGIRQFQSGQFDAAVESFSAAHVLNPNPMFLFNIAQAHRKAGRPREALTHYQLFLRKAPDSPLRPETEAYVALVQTQLAAGASPPPTSPAQDLQRPAGYGSSDQNPSPPRKVPIYKRGGFYVLLLGGAATVALAVGLPLYFATRPPATTLGIVAPVF
jgi:hypothetical protein